MASPEAEALKEAFKQLQESLGGSDYAPTIEEQRANVAGLGTTATVLPDVAITEAYAGGCRAYWHDPPGAVEDRAILYLHGGGYVLGSPKTHERLVSHLASATGARVLNLDYRLAPEHPHPAAVEDATAAYRWLLDQGFLPGYVAISGDSAGGGLSLAALISIREQGFPQPAGAVPLSPWVDLEGTGNSMVSNAENDLLVQKEMLQGMAASFLGEGGDARDPLAAPVYGDYRDLAPIYIQVGGDETLLDDSTRVVERAKAAGVEVKLDVFPEMQHVFQTGVGNVPEATDAVGRIGDWLRAKLGI
ncbi:MAG TPA: alpha/beta hydrolase [Dehalococcoidia bacterium]|nr:alpha/beta hydrolase [Dehalococcoidia bacterium]